MVFGLQDPHREYVNHWLRGDGRKVQTQTVLTFQPAREARCGPVWCACVDRDGGWTGQRGFSKHVWKGRVESIVHACPCYLALCCGQEGTNNGPEGKRGAFAVAVRVRAFALSRCLGLKL